MNSTLDVILVNRYNQSDEFRTVLPAKLCVQHVLVIMALAAAAVLVVGAGVGAAATTWYVDDGGGEGINFTKIQDAVSNASEGDHIFVYNGTYKEDVYWGGKSLSLQGENRGNTIIDASIGTKIGIWVSHGDDCVISGFTIQNGDEGINLHASNSTISNNIICNNTGDGISIRADNVTVLNNIITKNGYDSIILYTSSNTLIGNTINSNIGCGIHFCGGSNSTIADNNFTNNSQGIYIEDDSYNNTVRNNTISFNDDAGILVSDESTNNILINNTVFDNGDGISLEDSFYNSIINNNIFNNCDDGIDMDDSSNNNITNNIIYSNDDNGIDLDNSSNNRIYHNNLVCNDEQASDDGNNNSWDMGPVIGGNYWGDHACTGNPSDGSKPYHIDANSIDHYPFADPVGGFELPLIRTMVSIDSEQDYMERQYVSSSSFSSEPSGMTYRMKLEIDARCGRFNVPRIVIYNNTSINLERTYYQVDDVSNGTGNIDVFSDHIEWYGFDESVLSEFELGIHALNTYNMTPPFSSCRTIGKEVFDGNDTVDITVSATPASSLDEIEIKTYADETDDASSEILVDTASNTDFITFIDSTAVKWAFEDAVAGETYSTSIQAKVTPKTDSTVRYWLYTKIGAGYGEYADISSGSNQSFVQYVDTVLGTVQICFDEPVDYSLRANGKGTFYERYRAFSEVVDNGEPHTVRMWGNAYKPRVRTVPPGTTVRWTNTEQPVHTVTSDAGLWDSGNLADGQSFSYTFNIPGIYGYHDALHPSMKGTVIVQTRGDLNGDDHITPADAAIALAIAATGAQNPAADVSGDDRVTSLDALMIMQAAAENIEL